MMRTMWTLVAVLVAVGGVVGRGAQEPADVKIITALFADYDRAFVAKDLDRLATYVVIRDAGQWKIRHSHTSSRRRTPAL